MAGKDLAEKTLEGYNDVFADIVNVLLFGGKRIVQENDLIDYLPRSMYKADGKKVCEQERDVGKQWKNCEVSITGVFGIENQTNPEKYMPLRILSYDGAGYRKQLNKDDQKDEKQKTIYPVVTIVLHFGTAHKWNTAKSLYECVSIPEELKPYVSDYRINVVDLAFLDRKTVDLFQSDFWIVVDYLYQKRNNKHYVPSKTTIKHVEEVLQLMSIFTEDDRFLIAYNKMHERKAENMCEIVDQFIKEGEEKGRAEGIAEGRVEGRAEGIAEGRVEGKAEGKVEVTFCYVEDGDISVERGAEKLGMSVGEFLEKFMADGRKLPEKQA